MKKKLLITALSLTLAFTSISFASAATKAKTKVGTPTITYVGPGYYPYNTKKNITTENPAGTTGFTIDWSAVKGAAGYEPQINYKRDGKWSGWKGYYYDKENNLHGVKRWYFDTYQTYVKEAKQELKENSRSVVKKGYIWRSAVDKDGNPTEKKYTLSRYKKLFLSKTRADIAAYQDDTIYKFRVRAYKTVNGKKIYGPWSKEVTAKDKITAENMDYVYESVLSNVRAWAKENYPGFEVQDERTGPWDEALGEYPGYKPEGGRYYIVGSQRDWFSRYADPEVVINKLTESFKDYIDDVSTHGGNENAYLFIRKMREGSPEGLGSPQAETDIYFKTWILF